MTKPAIRRSQLGSGMIESFLWGIVPHGKGAADDETQNRGFWGLREKNQIRLHAKRHCAFRADTQGQKMASSPEASQFPSAPLRVRSCQGSGWTRSPVPFDRGVSITLRVDAQRSRLLPPRQ